MRNVIYFSGLLTLISVLFSGCEKKEDISNNVSKPSDATGWKKLGLFGPSITSVAASGSNFYSGTNDGNLFLSDDAGLTWKSIWPAQNGRYPIRSINLIGQNIFVATFGGGIFYSQDKGASWMRQNNGLRSLDVSSILAIGTDIYATTTSGIFLTTNSGASWSSINSSSYATSIAVIGNSVYQNAIGHGVAVSSFGNYVSTGNGGLTNTNVTSLLAVGNDLFCSTNGGGVFLSTNGGTSWNSVNNGLTNLAINKLFSDGSFIYAGTNGGGVFKTNDKGKTWNPIEFSVSGLAVNAISSTINYLLVGTTLGCFLSDNGKKGVETNNGMPGQPTNAVITAGNNVLTGTNLGLFLSSDNGQSWNWIKNGISGRVIKCFVSSGSQVFAGTDQGVFLSLDLGVSWKATASIQFASVALPINSMSFSNGNLFVGTDRLGVFRSNDNGFNWIEVNAELIKLDDPFRNNKVSCISNSGSIIFAGTEDPIYASRGNVYISKDDGLTWNISGLKPFSINSFVVKSLAANDSYIYTGLNYGVFISSDKGQTWSPANTGISTSKVNGIVLKEKDVYIATDNGVLMSIDNGKTWREVFGLNNLKISSITINGNLIYAATSSGVYSKSL
jgi:photosystem II stability/assembly factor-like uncharacterized protein